MSSEGGLIGAQAMREKFWEEMTDAERITKLAQELAWLWDRNAALAERLYKLEQHQHSHDGKLVVPLNDSRNYGESSGPQPRSRIWYVLGLAKR